MQCCSMLLSAVEILDFPFLVVDKSRSLDASCTQNGLKLELLEIMRACYLIARIHLASTSLQRSVQVVVVARANAIGQWSRA